MSLEQPLRLLRRPQVLERVGVSGRTLDRKIAAGGFPAPVHPGPGISAWLEHEVDKYIEDLMAARQEMPDAVAS